MIEHLDEIYILWLVGGPILAVLGWLWAGGLAERWMKNMLRALALATIFGFTIVGTDGAIVVLPLWLGFHNVGGLPLTISLIAVWWVIFALLIGGVNALLSLGRALDHRIHGDKL